MFFDVSRKVPNLFFSNFTSSLMAYELKDTNDKFPGLVGWSIISVWLEVSHSYVIAILGYVITCLLIIAFWVSYKRRYLDKLENTDFVRQCVSIIPVVICIAIMPKLLIYDYTIMNFLLIYLLLKIKVFEINYNFIFKSKISLLGITVIFIWAIQLILYFVRFAQPDEIFSSIIGVWFPIILVIIIALVDRSTKIKLGTWTK